MFHPFNSILVECLEPRRLFTTYFVAPTGSDANPGSIDHPFQTIQHALNVAVHPGDTVEVRAGTYHEMLTLKHSGTAGGDSLRWKHIRGSIACGVSGFEMSHKPGQSLSRRPVIAENPGRREYALPRRDGINISKRHM
jgi:Protein of unknown function (DUF1565)